MARMLPAVVPRLSHDDRFKAEKRIFDLLRDDPNTHSWTALHAVKLGARQKAGRPMHGEGIACLEVKAGKLHQEGRRWYRRGDPDPLPEDPHEQARRSMYALKKALDEEFGRGFCPIDYMLAFTEVDPPPTRGPVRRSRVMGARQRQAPFRNEPLDRAEALSPFCDNERVTDARLNLNCGNTGRIAQVTTIQRGFGDETFRVRADGEPGLPVAAPCYASHAELAAQVSAFPDRLVNEEEVPLEDIVILSPRRLGRSGLARAGDTSRYRSAAAGDQRQPDSASEARKPVLPFRTIHAFKGPEGPAVILGRRQCRIRPPGRQALGALRRPVEGPKPARRHGPRGDARASFPPLSERLGR